MRLLKFGTTNGLFYFPDQSSGQDNFMSLVTRASRLPGVSGGYDEYQGRRADQAIGSISTQVQLVSTREKTMRQMRDEIGAIGDWPAGYLFTDIWEDDRQDKRWCIARPDNVSFSENVKNVPHTQQQVPMTFQSVDPGWRGGQKAIYVNDGHYLDDGWYLDGSLFLDEGHTLDSGLYLCPKLDVQAFSGDTFTVTNRGNRAAVARLTISATEPEWAFGGAVRFGDGHYFDGGVAPVGNIHVRFSANGRIETEFTWGDTLQPGEALIVDAETQIISIRGRTGRSGFASFQRKKGLGFIHVPPGESTLSISGGMGARGCRLTLDYQDTFFTS